RDTRDEEEGHHQQERQRQAPLGRAERRQDECVQLVEDDRERDQDRGVATDRDRRDERLGDSERDRLAPVRQRVVHELQQLVVLPEAQAEGDRERRDRNDDASAKLVEVLDETQVLVV